MPIITIIRGAFGAGPEVAERVAADLGCPCVDREVLIEASNRYGIPEAKYEEVLESGPHWWERWRESLRLYRITLQAAMCEMARDGRLVYHGHMGQELLPGVSHVLKVLLTAPLEYQVEKVREREGLDEAGGRRYVESVNKARSRRMEAVFGADWRDASRYDLVLNVRPDDRRYPVAFDPGCGREPRVSEERGVGAGVQRPVADVAGSGGADRVAQDAESERARSGIRRRGPCLRDPDPARAPGRDRRGGHGGCRHRLGGNGF